MRHLEAPGGIWRLPWVGVVAALGACVFGVLMGRIGGRSSINLLVADGPLPAWNLVVCACLLLRSLALIGGTVESEFKQLERRGLRS